MAAAARFAARSRRAGGSSARAATTCRPIRSGGLRASRVPLLPRPSGAGYGHPVEFSPELRGRVAAGEITLTVRLWQRPRVKAGGRYRAAGVTLQVDDLELLPFAAISADD